MPARIKLSVSPQLRKVIKQFKAERAANDIAPLLRATIKDVKSKVRRNNKTDETKLVKAILDWLAAKGIFAWRTNNTAVYDPSRGVMRTFHGLKGVSDILGILSTNDHCGTFLAIEVKTETGKLSADQEAFLERIKREGGIAIVARSIDDVERALTWEGVI